MTSARVPLSPPRAVLLGVQIVLTTGTALAVASSWGPRAWWLGVAASALLTGLALGFERHPLWPAILGQAVALIAVVISQVLDLPAEPSPAAAVALGALTSSRIRRLPWRWASVVAAGALLVPVASLAASGFTDADVPPVPQFNLLAWVVAVAWGLVRRSLDDRTAALTLSVRREVELDLARELHDVVGHHLTGIIVQAQAGQLVAPNAPATAHQILRDIELEGSRSLTAIRRVLGLLREDSGETVRCDEHDIRALAQQVFGRQPSTAPQVTVRVERSSWSPLVELTAYRTIQEALTNTARHAPAATQVDVVVEQLDGTLHVRVHDDGPSQAPAEHSRRDSSTGYGLVGMTERVEALGGTLTAGVRPEGGWGVHAQIPAHRSRQA